MEIQKPEYNPNTYVLDTAKTSVSKKEQLVNPQAGLKNGEAVAVSISEEGFFALRKPWISPVWEMHLIQIH